ncbi:MAG: hypothetical protein J5743_07900 [Victivallales bacterium]|nr:hypothetical protein [Victivallales bacterium]
MWYHINKQKKQNEEDVMSSGQNPMQIVRILARASVVAIGLFATSGAFAAALTVASGETISVNADETYDSITVEGTLVVTGAKLTSVGPLALMGGTVRLGENATLTVSGVAASSAASTIEFNGGRLVTSGSINAGSVELSLVGNTGDVVVDLNFTSWAYAFTATSGGKTTVSGSRKLVLSVKGNSIGLVNNASYLAMSHTGRTEIRGGNLSANFDKFPNSGELFIAGGATLDIGGTWFTFGSLTGAGNVVGTTGQITIDVPYGSTGCCYPAIASTVTLIKKGTGTLNVIGTMPSSFGVTNGVVRAVPRSEVGYSQFRFKVDGANHVTGNAMQLNELSLVSAGGVAEYATSTAGKKLFDGDDATKWWYSYADSSNPSFDDAYVDVTFADRIIPTGYKIKSSDWGADTPKAWRLYGRDAGGEWELLDERANEETAPQPKYNWSPEYFVSCAMYPGATICTALTLEKGTTLSTAADTVLSCVSLTDRGASYSFAAGSAVDIGVVADCEAKGIVGAGAFAKSGAADLVSYGATSPESIHVKGGVLALHAPVAWKFWKLAIGGANGTDGIAFGEFAVYDQNGNRLNVTGTDTMSSYQNGSFASTTASSAKLYDGVDSGQAWCSLDGLDIADEASWKWTSFKLADGAPAVSGYSIRTATYVGGQPKTWKLYASEDGVAWTEIDSKVNAAYPSTASTWYNGGRAWLVSSGTADTVAAFPSATPVTIDPGATLDISYAEKTKIGDIRIDGDAVGYGTISGGALAAQGTIRVLFAGVVPSAPYSLPLKLDDVADARQIRNWTLVVNDEAVSRRRISLDANGQLTVVPNALIIILR